MDMTEPRGQHSHRFVKSIIELDLAIGDVQAMKLNGQPWIEPGKEGFKICQQFTIAAPHIQNPDRALLTPGRNF
jgi:hypothetical protein